MTISFDVHAFTDTNMHIGVNNQVKFFIPCLKACYKCFPDIRLENEFYNTGI